MNILCIRIIRSSCYVFYFLWNSRNTRRTALHNFHQGWRGFSQNFFLYTEIKMANALEHHDIETYRDCKKELEYANEINRLIHIYDSIF